MKLSNKREIDVCYVMMLIKWPQTQVKYLMYVVSLNK